MTEIILSICCITYNHEKFIKQAIDGFLSQETNFPYEIIIHDDRSTDDTQNIIREYEKKYPSVIKAIYQSENQKSQGKTIFPIAFAKAKGKYIAMCEGDDFWTDKNKLQKQVDLLEKNPDFVGSFHETQVLFEDGSSGKVYGKDDKNILTAEDTITSLSPFHTSSFIFRNILKELPGWFSNVISGDMALFSIVASQGPLCKAPGIMSVYRKHKDGFTNTNPVINNLHQKRIELINYLNEFHNYKFNAKAAEVIEHHKKEIEVKNKSEINIPENFDKFLNINLSPDNMDLFYVRSSIKNAIDNNLNNFNGTFLDLGCGEMPYRKYILENSNITKYIGIDIKNPAYQKSSMPDLFWDGKTIPLKENSVDTLMATELFEHLPDIQSVLNEINRVLKPGGILFFTVPFLWPLHDAPYDEYRYTPFSLERHINKAGFSGISINALGGWNASLAQMIGLWLKRSDLEKEQKEIFANDLFTFYQYLIQTDKVSQTFGSQVMTTGFSGTAIKKEEKIFKANETGSEMNTEIKVKNKIVIIQGGFPSVSATFILDQITGLIERGFEIENWAVYDTGTKIIHEDVKKYDLLNKTKFIQFPSESLKNDHKNWFQEFYRINNIENINDVSAFHIHYGANFNLFEPLFRITDKFTLVSFHGYDASRYFKQNGDNCYNFLFQRANLITTPSSFMKNELVKRGCNPGKIIIHRYGIDLEKFRYAERKFNNSKLSFLTVGRFVEKKGIEYSLKAFAKIANQVNAEYRIIGEGELLEKYMQIVKENKLENKVRFLGPKTKDEIVKEMKDADVFILTSITAYDGDSEGVPVALTEANAIGLPVISTFHSGIPELIFNNKNGLLSEEKDIDNIALNMVTLAGDISLRKAFSENAVKRVEGEFDIRLLNDKLAKYFPIDKDVKDPLLNALNHIGWDYKYELYKNHFEEVKELKKVNNPSISIIVISWRLHPDNLKSFQILDKQREHNFELIFVDNGGKEGEFESLKPYINTYVKLNNNTGAYLARNIGTAFAKSSLLLFLEDDGIPENDLIKAHLDLYMKYDIIACRGVYIPKTNNPLNKKQNWYYISDKDYPTFAHIEGNTSYLADTFFKAGGWDDEIQFGGGGLELYFRLLNVDPDRRKQIYSPVPIIYHDYVKDEKHLNKKLENQNQSFERLRAKYPDWDNVTRDYKKYSGRPDLLINKKLEQNTLKSKGKSIAFFTHYSEMYGANRSLIKTIEEFLKKGYKIIVILPAAGKLTEYFSENEITYYIHPFPWIFTQNSSDKNLFQERFRNTLSNIKPIIENCLLHKVDLIYSNSSVIDIGIVVSKIISKPHVWHVREFGDLDYNIYPDVGSKIFTQLLKSSEGLIFISKALQENFQKKYGISGRVIYNGILSKIELNYLNKLKKKNSIQKEFNFLIVGLVHECKGQDKAVEAFSRVIKKYPDVTLTIAGGGETEWITNIVNSLSLQDSIKILGNVDNPFEHFAESNISLMCSENEAFGRVTLESMSCGIPVIGRNSGGTSEIIIDGYNGLLYDGTIEDLASKMIYSIENPGKIKSYGINGIETVHKYFTTDIYANNISDYLDSIISNYQTESSKFKINHSELSSEENEIIRFYEEIFMLNSTQNNEQKDNNIIDSQTIKDENVGLNSYILEAEDFIQKENYDEANKILLSILDLDPQNIDALNDLAVIQILKENFNEAAGILKIICSIDPQNDVALGNVEYLVTNKLISEVFFNSKENESENFVEKNEIELKHLQNNWNTFGEKDPMWAILTDPSKKNNGWKPGEFFETGINDINRIIAYTKEQNLKINYGRAVDFGCGVGRLTQALAMKFDEVYGVDIAPSMIEKANYYNRFSKKCKYILNSKIDLSFFNDKYFDFIYTIITLQHMKPQFSKNFIKEFLRILKPEGILIFQVPSRRVNQMVEVSEDAIHSVQSFDPINPVMEMHGIYKDKVIEIINDNGANIIDIQVDKSLGEDWESFRYCVKKG